MALDYPLYYEGKQSGLLKVSHIGEDTCFELSGEEKSVYRAWVEGEQGELLLGIMENGRLCRRFSPQMTRRIGRPVCARLERLAQPEPNWQSLSDHSFFGWELPSHARCRKKGGRYEVALPYREDELFPLLPLFCFAKIGNWGGRRWAFFCFDEKGRPLMEEK